jgi:hypothetical protein
VELTNVTALPSCMESTDALILDEAVDPKFRVGTVGNGEDVPLVSILTLTGTAAQRAREPRP